MLQMESFRLKAGDWKFVGLKAEIEIIMYKWVS